MFQHAQKISATAWSIRSGFENATQILICVSELRCCPPRIRIDKDYFVKHQNQAQKKNQNVVHKAASKNDYTK